MERKLGFWESALCLLHDELAGTGTIFNAVLLEGEIDAVILQEALKHLFDRHPLLHSTIAHRHDGYHFKLDADWQQFSFKVINRKSDSTWQAVVQHELGIQFVTEHVLWRAILVSSEQTDKMELVLLFHHAIADGLSCTRIMNELLEVCRDLTGGKHKVEAPLALLPPVEVLLDRAALPACSKVTNLTPVNSEKVAYQVLAPLSQRVTNNLYYQLSADELSGLVNHCKHHQVKVNSIFNAAMSLTASHFTGNHSLSLLTPVNLRGLCSPVVSANDFGCYINCVSTDFDGVVDAEDIWKLAKLYEERLQQGLAHLVDLPTGFSLKDKESLSSLLCIDDVDSREHFPAGFVVTNKGKVSFSKHYGGIDLQAYYTSSSRRAGDIPINLSITSALEQTFLVFSYTSPLVAEAWAERFAEFYINLLRDNATITLETNG